MGVLAQSKTSPKAGCGKEKKHQSLAAAMETVENDELFKANIDIEGHYAFNTAKTMRWNSLDFAFEFDTKAVRNEPC